MDLHPSQRLGVVAVGERGPKIAANARIPMRHRHSTAEIVGHYHVEAARPPSDGALIVNGPNSAGMVRPFFRRKEKNGGSLESLQGCSHAR